MTATDTTPEAVQQTLAEYERLAISTGAKVQIDPPEFWSGIEGEAWAPFWLPQSPPKVARATVHRDGVPTTVYISWEESLPADEDWRALWMRKPMKLFGAYTLRAAIRRAYRDVIGDRREPDEMPDGPAVVQGDRDWLDELGKTNTTAEVRQLHAEAKSARAVTVELEREIRLRLIHVAQPPARATSRPSPADVARRATPESSEPA